MRVSKKITKDPEYLRVKAWYWVALTFLVVAIIIARFGDVQYIMWAVLVAFLVGVMKYYRLRKKYLVH